MGTRAVVHVDLRTVGIGKDVWIATHWDGQPMGLGESLKNAIRDEISKSKKEYGKNWKKYSSSVLGSVMQTAVWKGSAEHAIDFSTTSGKEEFDKMYGDWAEYEYEVDAKTGKIKYRTRSGEWQKAVIGKWKSLSMARKKLDKVV